MKRISRREYEAQVKPTPPKTFLHKSVHMLARNAPFAAWRVWLFRAMGVSIGQGVTLGADCFFDDQFPGLITVEDGVSIGDRVLIVVHDDTQGGASGPGDILRLSRTEMIYGYVGPVHLGRGCIIGPRAILLPGVEVGENAVVEAGSVVKQDVAPGNVVAGSPARVVLSPTPTPIVEENAMTMPASAMPRQEYERKVRRSRLQRAWQKVLLLTARFTIPTALRTRLYRAMGARLDPGCYVGLDCYMDDEFPELITAEPESGFTIRTNFITHGVAYRPSADGGAPERVEYVAPIVIGARSWIGAGTTVMPGVTIGRDVIAGAGTVITEDVPDGVVVVGNPARVIKQRSLGNQE